MPSKKIKTPLVADRYYHIYNRGNNRENIFYKDEHYKFFLDKYVEMVHPYVHTYAYCLLPNHFHFMIKVKPDESFNNSTEPSHLLRRYFQYYAIWLNKQQNRRGSLFTKYYRRVEISDEFYLRRLVYYIHRNPVKHGITEDFKNYPYGSFHNYLNFHSGIIARSETLSWFNDNMLEFLEFHNILEEKTDSHNFFIED